MFQIGKAKANIVQYRIDPNAPTKISSGQPLPPVWLSKNFETTASGTATYKLQASGNQTYDLKNYPAYDYPTASPSSNGNPVYTGADDPLTFWGGAMNLPRQIAHHPTRGRIHGNGSPGQ